MAQAMERSNRWAFDAGPVFAGEALDGPIDVEIAIIGGGITGLSTAWHLADRGADTILLEAGRVGEGATGLSGGQVVPGFKTEPEALRRMLGEHAMRQALDFAFESADYTFRMIEQLGIDCHPTRKGWLQVAVTEPIAERLRKRSETLRSLGARLRFLSRDEVAEATGSSHYRGALFEEAAGAVHPLRLARGLARAASERGARICQDAPVDSLEREQDHWRLRTGGHHVRARRVILATDAYTSRLYPRLERSFLTVSSAQIATEPLPGATLEQVLPWRAGISESRKIPHYCRIDPDGRFLIGGRGPNAAAIDEATIERLRRAAIERFPILAGVRWTHGWLGRVGLALSDTPQLVNPAPGLWAAYGYSGRGLALAFRMGLTLSALAASERPEFDYPLGTLKPLPWHGLRQPAITAALAWYRVRDAMGLVT